MRLLANICTFLAFLAILPAMAQEETREYPLGPIGGRYRVTPNSSYARIVSLDSGAPGITAGLQVGDYLYGAFGKIFTPTGSSHYGVTQELGFAVDRAEGAGGTLPLKLLRPGTGSLDISVTLPAAGAFGPAYPRASAKHQAAFESACAWLHQKVMGTSDGDMGYYTGWTGLCLLGHPNWNATTGAKPYRLSINRIRDRCVDQITTGVYASVEDKLLDGTANPNYVSGARSNWQLGQMVIFLSEYYAKTADTGVVNAIQRGAEMCANTVQWWKQPALHSNGYSPEGTQIAGIVSHGGVIGDYIHLGWGGGINICGVYSFNGMAFARHVGMNMAVRPRDGHYFGYPTAPAGAVEAGKEDYNHTLDEKFLMQWKWMTGPCGFFPTSPGGNDDGHIAYTNNAPSGFDAAGRTPATLLGMAFYKRDDGALTAADEDKLARLKGYVSRQYMRQQESHAYCVGAQVYQALATAFLSDRQQRFALDNWRFYYALSRTPAGGFQYFQSRSVPDNYLDETHCAAIDMAMPYVVANGGLNSIPAINGSPNQVIANFLSPDISWPTIEARKISAVGSTLAMPVSLVDGQGVAVSSGYTASWTKISGPGTVTFNQPAAATTDMTFSVTGNYRVQLTVVRGGYTLVEPIDVSVRLNAPPAGYVGGLANYQVYTGISGTTVANLTEAVKFPNSPDIARTVTSLVGNYSGDNYGARLSGCLIAPVTGPYRFYIASDDNSQLKLNSSGLDPAGATEIASVTGATNVQEWNKFTSQQSAVINLTAGQAYAFEALHKEAGGGDHLSVGWSINGGAIEVIDGIHLAIPDLSAPTTMSITAQPQSVSTVLGGAVTLSVSTSGPQPAIYQWRRNGVNIGLPTSNTALTFPNVSGGAEGSYDCVYTTAIGSLTSNAAQVTVTDDGDYVAGGLWREVYVNINGAGVADLTSHAKFPSMADASGPISSADAPDNYADKYGQRITGWIKPTVSGNYRFHLAANETAEVWIGANEQPASMSRILQLSGATGLKEWSAGAASAYITLQAGHSYYLEIRHKEDGGDDHCSLAWQLQGDPDPVNGTGEIPGEFLSYRVGGIYTDIPLPSKPPVFTADPFAASNAYVGVAYTGQSIASAAVDFNSSDTLTFSKISGPSWLNIAANGALSGTPTVANLGLNTFSVRVVDPTGFEDTGTFNITVVNARTTPVWANAAGGSWPVAGNWVDSDIANGQNQTADFSTLNLNSNVSVTLDGARTIGQLRFGDLSPSNNLTLATGSGGTLTLATTSGTPAIDVANQTAIISATVAGSQGFIKTGSGTLALTGNNTYAGATTVSAGILQLGSSTALGGTATGTTISNGATFDIFGQSLSGSTELITVTGKGNNDGGAVINSSSSKAIMRRTTLAGDTTVTLVSGDLMMGSYSVVGALNLDGYTLTKNGAGTLILNGISMSGAGNINVTEGTLQVFDDMVGGAPRPTTLAGTGNLTVNAGASLMINRWSMDLTMTMPVILNGGNFGSEFPGPNGAIIASPITLAATSKFSFGDGGTGDVTLSGVISGPGGLVRNGTEATTLTGANTYTGTTTVDRGALMVNGSLATGAVTVNNSGSFGGVGTIGGAVTVVTGGKLIPGFNGIGTLTINNTLSLAGTTEMQISKTGTARTADKVSGLTSVTYGGALIVTQLASDALAAGDTFQLFSATTRSGSFTSIALPTLNSGLKWSVEKLAIDGSIKVVALTEIPVATNDSMVVNEDGTGSFAVLTNDSDADGGVLAIRSVTQGAHGTVAIAGNQVSYTPAANWNGTDNFTYTITDNDDGTATATVTVTVNPGNDAPVFTVNPFSKAAAVANRDYTGQTLAGSATDIDASDTLNYAKISGPAWLSVAANGALSGTPAASDLGANSFVVRVIDSSNATSTATLNLNVIHATWTNPSGGSWNLATNWLSNAIGGGAGTTVRFDTLDLTSDSTVNLDGARTIGGLIFNDTVASHNWRLNTGSGGPLTMDSTTGVPWIAVDNQSVTIGAVLAGNEGLSKTGTGSLTLSATNTYTGTTWISGGIVKLGNKSAFGAVVSGSSVTQVIVADGAAVDFNGIGDAYYGYTISGSGVGGAGALINTGAIIGTGTGQATNIKLAADAVVGGTGNWALLTYNWLATSLDLSGFTLTKTDANTIALASTTLTGGTLKVSAGTLAFGVSNGGSGVTGGLAALTLDNTPGVSLSLARASSIGSLAGGGADGGNISLGSNILTVGALPTNTTYAGVISGSGGGLTKTGEGILSLSAANTYTGTTTINGGALLVNGSLATTVTTPVAAAGTLGGSGTLAGAVTNNGTIAPGNNAVGNLTVNNTVTLAVGSKMAWEINNWTGAAGTGYDTLTAATLNITATSASPVTIFLDDLDLANFSETNRTFTLVQTNTAITGFVANRFTVNASDLALPQGTWIVQLSGNGRNLELAYTANANPDSNANGILDNWETTRFGNANAGANRPGDDADKDGLTNLMEYALDTNPLVRNAGPAVDYDAASHLRITVNKNPQASNLIYTVETSSALNDWSTANTVIETSPSNQLIVRDTFDKTTAPRRFIRLKVRTNP